MIVRGAVPCIVSMNIAVTAVASADVIRTALVEGINALPVGKGSIDAQDLIDALPDDVTLRSPYLSPFPKEKSRSAQGVAPDWAGRGNTSRRRRLRIWITSWCRWVKEEG